MRRERPYHVAADGRAGPVPGFAPEKDFNGMPEGASPRAASVPGKKSLHIESSGQLCIYCGACVGICPLNCIYLDETRITFDEKVCTRCEICVKACPVGAIEIG